MVDVATVTLGLTVVLTVSQLVCGLAIARNYSQLRQLRASIPADTSKELAVLSGDVKACKEQVQRSARAVASVAGTFRSVASQLEQVRY